MEAQTEVRNPNSAVVTLPAPHHTQDTTTAYDILTPEDVAEWLHVSVKWLYDHTSRCKPIVPHVRLGGHLRFRRAAIESWLDSQERCA